MFLGYSSNSSGTYSLTGGSLSASSEIVGLSGSGSFTQSGGPMRRAIFSLGNPRRRRGTYTLDGGLLSVDGFLTLGDGSAAFNFGGGTLQAAQLCRLRTHRLDDGGQKRCFR